MIQKTPDQIKADLVRRGLVDYLYQAASKYFVLPDNILAHHRYHQETHARHYLWMIIRQHTNLSYPEIAKLFCFDHVSVIYGVTKAKERIKEEDHGT